MIYTVKILNAALGTSHFRGWFPTPESARAYLESQRTRVQPFISFEVWTGPPSHPAAPSHPGAC